MAICQDRDAILAFQFHPESILTTFGATLLAQSFDYLLALSERLNTKPKEHNMTNILSTLVDGHDLDQQTIKAFFEKNAQRRNRSYSTCECTYRVKN